MLIRILTLLGILSILSCATSVDKDEQAYQERYAEKLYPFEGYFDQKNYPEQTFAYKQYFKNLKQASNDAPNTRSIGQWDLQGPGNIGGRVNEVKVDPTNDQIIYLGYSQGGIWKTTNGGADWQPIFDEQAYLSISTVDIDPTDNQILYAGTGDHNISGYPFIGDGVYKSIDGGVSWQNIGLGETAIISKVCVSQRNSNTVYAATMGLPFERNSDRGLYKSNNGGQQWEQVLYINDSTGVIDIVVDPTNENIVFAATWNRIRNDKESFVSGPDAAIYKTMNGGISWTKLTQGLPVGSLSRIGLERFGTGSDTLFAAITSRGGNINCGTSGIDLEGIYRSYDGGRVWTNIPTAEVNGLRCNILGGFGWYFGKIAVNPNDPDDIFVLGVDLWRTRDGGQNWNIAAPEWFQYDVHADKHDIEFVGENMYLGTDGGAYRATINNENWQDIENIPSTQFYRIAIDPNEPDVYYGGAQDNGSTGGNSSYFDAWPRIYGGDGFQMAFNPLDPMIITAETQRGNINITYDQGFSWQDITFELEGNRNWDMPYFMKNSNPNIIITGSDRVYEIDVTNQFNTLTSVKSDVLTDPDPTAAFSQTISAVGESILDPEILMAGTSDGRLWITKDDGNNWSRPTNGLPRRYISCVAGSTVNPAVFYVSYTGYKSNDFTPLLYKSINGGASWTSIAGNLPNLSINNFEIVPGYDDQVIFVGTDGGVYYTENGGDEWLRVGDMPVIPVYDVEYNSALNQMVAGTFARGILSYDMDQLGLSVISSIEDEIAAIPFNIYPTVASNQLTLDIPDFDNEMRATIVDYSGRIVINQKITSAKSTLDVSSVANGNYILSLSGKKGTSVKKFIVVR